MMMIMMTDNDNGKERGSEDRNSSVQNVEFTVPLISNNIVSARMCTGND